MGGTTAAGWPYVTPDDHPKEFPAHSQALANKLQSTNKAVGGRVSAVFALAGGWGNGSAIVLPTPTSPFTSWAVTATAQDTQNGKAYLVTLLTATPTTSCQFRIYDIAAPTSASGNVTVVLNWHAVAV